MTITIDLGAVPVKLERDPDTGRFVAFNEDVRTMAAGDTAEEATANFQVALRELVNYCLEQGMPIPSPIAAGRLAASA